MIVLCCLFLCKNSDFQLLTRFVNLWCCGVNAMAEGDGMPNLVAECFQYLLFNSKQARINISLCVF